MARCDFSNAVLSLTANSNIATDYYSLGLSYSGGGVLFKQVNGTYQPIVTNNTLTTVVQKSKVLKFIYNGTFTESGTSFYFGHASENFSTGDNATFKISNISFNAGDTYSFEIDATYTFN